MSDYIRITKGIADEKLKQWESDKNSVPKKQYLYEYKRQYHVIDNRSGDFFCESFDSFEIAEMYLDELADVNDCLIADRVVGKSLDAWSSHFKELEQTSNSQEKELDIFHNALGEHRNTIKELNARIQKLEKIIIEKELEKV